MALYKQFTLAVLTDDDNGISTSQTPAAGGAQNLTITGAQASGGVATTTNNTAQKFRATWAGADAGRTLTFTYVDADGNAQTGTLSGANSTTSDSSFYGVSVSVISVDANTAGAVEVGWVASTGMVTNSYPTNRYNSPFNASLIFNLTAGSMTLSAQFTVDSPADSYTNGYSNDADWRNVVSLTSVAADAVSNIAFPVMAIRFVEEVGSSTGAGTGTYIQSN